MTFPSGGYTSLSQATTDSLVHCWEMNETSGTSIFDSVDNGAITVTPVVTADSGDNSIVTGKFGNARDFDVETADARAFANNSTYSPLGTDWTLSFWYKLNTTSAAFHDIIYSTGNQTPTDSENWYIQITSSDTLRVKYPDSNASQFTGATVLSTATWYHICLVGSSSGVELFINNSSEASDAGTLSLDIYDVFQFSSYNAVSGVIDDVAIWDRELNTTERGYIYNSGTGQKILSLAYAETLTESISSSQALVEGIPLEPVLSEIYTIAELVVIPYYAKIVKELMNVDASLLINATQNIFVDESLTFEEVWGIIFLYSLSESLDSSESISNLALILETILESADVSDLPIGPMITANVITEILNLSDSLNVYWQLFLLETFNINHTLNVLPNYYNEIVDVLSVNETNIIAFSFLLEEDIEIADSASYIGILQHLIEEGLGFLNIRLAPGETSYTGWVMNPETFSVWNYENYNFNSFAKFNNNYFGAYDGGIYQLDSTTDDGSYIESKIVTAALDFGSRNIKQVPLSYFGITSDGKIVLQIRVDNKADVWYELTPVENYQHTHKVTIGKGLIGRNWQFELTTKDNSSIDFENIEFYPVIFKRKL